MKYTLKDFQAEYPDDDACLEAVFQDRLGDLEYCPKCGTQTKFYRVKERQSYACMHCGHHVFPLADTIFRKTQVPLVSWFYAIYLFSVSKNGVSAKEIERHLGVSYVTAWRMCKQIRILMGQDDDPLGGDGEMVEVDETYIGGRRKLKQKFDNKSIVFGAVERDGRAVAVKVKTAGARVLLPLIENNVVQGTHIHSDEWRSYSTLKRRGYSHTTVNHSKLEYVRGTAHMNTIEGFWSQLKRSIDGTYHAVSPKYLQMYLNQFAFYYNHRHVAVGPVLLEKALKPVLSET